MADNKLYGIDESDIGHDMIISYIAFIVGCDCQAGKKPIKAMVHCAAGLSRSATASRLNHSSAVQEVMVVKGRVPPWFFGRTAFVVILLAGRYGLGSRTRVPP